MRGGRPVISTLPRVRSKTPPKKFYRRYKQSPLYHLRVAWSSIPSALPPRPSARKIGTAEFVSRSRRLESSSREMDLSHLGASDCLQAKLQRASPPTVTINYEPDHEIANKMSR